MTAEAETAAQVLTAFMSWFTYAFNSLDRVYFMDISYLNIMVAISVFTITWWGVSRILDSNKSDA